MTAPEVDVVEVWWWGLHLMETSGRWGLDLNCWIRSEGGMRFGDIPGKFVSKKAGTDGSGSDERDWKVDGGAKSVHVNDLSLDGMAMNIIGSDDGGVGQMWRWLGDMAKSLPSLPLPCVADEGG